MAGLEQVSPEELATAGFIAQQGFNDGKNVAAYALMASPIQTALHCAGSDSSKSVEFNEVAIRTCYNLAANTWVGWGEDEVKIGDQEANIGLQAAELNVCLAQELDLPANRRKNGCWILGAHMLAAGNHDEAKQYHTAMRVFAKK